MLVCGVCGKTPKHVNIFRWFNGIINNKAIYCDYCIRLGRTPMTAKQVKAIQGTVTKIINKDTE